MSEHLVEFELGETIDRYRISRIVVGVAWLATVIFGLIWVALMIMAVGMSLQGDVDFWGILAGGLPITLLFGASVYGTFRVQRTLMHVCENGFEYREGRVHVIVPYGDISSADLIVEHRWRHSKHGRRMVEIRWIRVRLEDEARSEIRIQPLLLADHKRFVRWQSLLSRRSRVGGSLREENEQE
jgi:hypothetical protein